MARISVQSAKAKGRNLQKWTAMQISLLIGMEHGKDCPIESRPMGQNGVDIRMEKKALKRFPFSVECKNQQSWGVHKWIEQAKANMLPNTDWLIIAKRNNHKPVVMMDAVRFFELLNQVKKKDIFKRTKNK